MNGRDERNRKENGRDERDGKQATQELKVHGLGKATPVQVYDLHVGRRSMPQRQGLFMPIDPFSWLRGYPRKHGTVP